MKKINTVLGTIEREFLGSTLCHEHVACLNPSFYMAFGEKWMKRAEVIDNAVAMCRRAKEDCDISTIIDGTPIDLGRDIDMIREVSQKSGVNILISSGIYCSEEQFLWGKKAEKLAEFFIYECQNGVAGTNVKPAILKCATGKRGVTEINELLLNTMSITQKETDLPMFAHNEHKIKTAPAQLKIFEKNGVNLEKVVIGHCSDSYDIEYLIGLLKSGVYLGFDRIYPTHYERQAETIAKLIERGYEDKILVSHDFFAFSDFKNNDFEVHKKNGRDFTTVHKQLFSALKKIGIEEKQIQKLTINNPKNLL